MELKVVRKNLLDQHENLRRLMRELEQALEEGSGVGPAVTALNDAWAAHIIAEEAVLVPILRDVDAWGPERVNKLIEQHREEHQVMLRKLDPIASKSELRSAVTELQAHMEEEEATNLAAKVLNDDKMVNTDGGD